MDKEKIIKSLIEAIKFVLVVIALVIGISLMFRYVPFLAKYDNFVIRTDSMEPNINIGDMVFVDNTFDVDSLVPGDVIAFNIDLNGDGVEEVVVHYFDELVEIEGLEYFKSISNVSEDQDPWTLSLDAIIGRYSFKIPFIGKFALFAQSTLGRIVIILDILIISVLVDMLKKEKVE